MNSSELSQKLQMIGFRVSGNPSELKDLPDIENTLFEAIHEITTDGRIFSLLCSWILVHGDKVII